VSKIQTIPEVLSDPLAKRRLLYSEDPKTGIRITLAPPPKMTPFLDRSDRRLSFPPRFGEHNEEVYERLGYSKDQLNQLKREGIL
jgi:formyl-CoA transferase